MERKPGRFNPFLVFLFVGLVFVIIGISADRVFLYVSFPFLALGLYGMLLAFKKPDDDDQNRDDFQLSDE